MFLLNNVQANPITNSLFLSPSVSLRLIVSIGVATVKLYKQHLRISRGCVSWFLMCFTMDTKQTAVRFLPVSTQVEEWDASPAKLNRRLISLTVCPEIPLFGSLCSAKHRNSSPVARFFSNRVFQTARILRFYFLCPTTTSRFTYVQFLIHTHKRYAKGVSRKNKIFLRSGLWWCRGSLAIEWIWRIFQVTISFVFIYLLRSLSRI